MHAQILIKEKELRIVQKHMILYSKFYTNILLHVI